MGSIPVTGDEFAAPSHPAHAWGSPGRSGTTTTGEVDPTASGAASRTIGVLPSSSSEPGGDTAVSTAHPAALLFENVRLRRRLQELEQNMQAPPQRQSLLSPLKRLEEIAGLGPDWDSYGAESPDQRAVIKAGVLVAAVEDRLSLVSGVNPLPWAIAPIGDGSVQVEWKGEDVAIEVEVRADGPFIYLIEKDDVDNLEFDEGEVVGAEDMASLVARVVGE